jgi:hypothetical protein
MGKVRMVLGADGSRLAPRPGPRAVGYLAKHAPGDSWALFWSGERSVDALLRIKWGGIRPR